MQVTFSEVTSITTGDVGSYLISGASPTADFAISDDGGLSWSIMQNGLFAQKGALALAYSPDQVRYMAGGAGPLPLATSRDGRNFTTVTSFKTLSVVNGIVAVGTSTWVLTGSPAPGTSFNVAVSTDEGATFSGAVALAGPGRSVASFAGDEISSALIAVCGVSSNGGRGNVAISGDSGLSWLAAGTDAVRECADIRYSPQQRRWILAARIGAYGLFYTENLSVDSATRQAVVWTPIVSTATVRTSVIAVDLSPLRLVNGTVLTLAGPTVIAGNVEMDTGVSIVASQPDSVLSIRGTLLVADGVSLSVSAWRPISQRAIVSATGNITGSFVGLQVTSPCFTGQLWGLQWMQTASAVILSVNTVDCEPLSRAAIIGIVTGALFIVMIVAVVIYFIAQAVKSSQASTDSTELLSRDSSHEFATL